jgi:hypothetical protein
MLGYEIDWKKLTVNVIIGYIVSWLYFFITLPLFQILFGKALGKVAVAGINYGLSWIVWFWVTKLLTFAYAKGDEV